MSARFWLVLALLVQMSAAPGCAFLYQRGPRSAKDAGSCDASPTSPWLDVVFGGAYVGTAAYYGTTGGTAAGTIQVASSALWAAVHAASAWWGLRAAARCRALRGSGLLAAAVPTAPVVPTALQMPLTAPVLSAAASPAAAQAALTRGVAAAAPLAAVAKPPVVAGGAHTPPKAAPATGRNECVFFAFKASEESELSNQRSRSEAREVAALAASRWLAGRSLLEAAPDGLPCSSDVPVSRIVLLPGEESRILEASHGFYLLLRSR